MAKKWLYNASGHPVAFIQSDKVYSSGGHFIGRLNGNEVWHGKYIGEIVRNDRFLRDVNKGSIVRGTPIARCLQTVQGWFGLMIFVLGQAHLVLLERQPDPGSKSGISLSSKYHDVDLD